MATPLELIREAEGKPLAQIAKNGVGGFFLAIALAAISGVQAIVDLLLLPFELSVDIGQASVEALILRPFDLSMAGFISSFQSISGLEGFVGAFGLPISIFIIMLTLFMVIAFIAFGITANTFPGLIVDNPIWDFLFVTPEEEADDEG